MLCWWGRALLDPENHVNKFENMLKNMVISDIDEFTSNNKKSLTIDLLQQGFSKNIVSEFVEKFNDDYEDNPRLFFYHYLAKKLVTSYEDKILNADIIFVNGPSGSGKTTLCSKKIRFVTKSCVFSEKRCL